MKRRRLVALVSLVILGAIMVVVAATGAVLTTTDLGQDQVRRVIAQQIGGAVNGKVYVGRIRGSWITGVTIDSIAIRDERDSLFLSTGRVIVDYDPRDLIDRRILVRRLDVERPYIHLRQYQNGEWNYQRIFRKKGPDGPRTPGRHFGDYVVLDSVRVRDGGMALTMPWSPDATLRGARRDSAVRVAMAVPYGDLRRVTDDATPGYARTYHWFNAAAQLSHLRLADPDSNKFGRMILVDSLHVVESDPPFRFRNVRGTVRQLGDSLWAEVPHFDLPASTGSAKIKVVWGSNKPVRYDIAVRGDEVALADVAWVYPTLPITGGGKLNLHIGNDPKNLRILEYRLSEMDVRTTKSHLMGAMTFAVGGPMLAVKDVDMRAAPINWDLLRTFSGEPFPVDYQGDIEGTVRGKGGPLNHFVVDEAQAVWRDGHVPGAVSRASAKGELDIFDPANTKFHHFSVDVAALDMRTIEFLYPENPKIGGIISGTAVLDSSYLDLRFSNADISHRNGEGVASRFTGGGRVTYGDAFMTYDLDVVAQPVSFDMLARSFPTMPLRGIMTGPLKVKGTVADLQLTASLQGDAGSFSFDGTMDSYEPHYAVRGTGRFANLDVSKLMDSAEATPTRLNGEYSIGVAGDSAANLDGQLAISLDGSTVLGTRVYGSRSRLRFTQGRLLVDTMRVESIAGAMRASGALGLPGGPVDSLHVEIALDSLGGVRRYILANGATDSLSGAVTLSTVLRGRVDSMDVSGTASGSGIVYATTKVKSASARFALTNVLRAPRGLLSFTLDTTVAGGVVLDTIGGAVRLDRDGGGTFAAAAVSRGPYRGVPGPRYAIAGTATANAEGSVVTLSQVEIDTDSSAWRLAGPALIVNDSTGLSIDSLVLRSDKGASIEARGVVPVDGFASAQLRATRFPLHDVAMLLQMPDTMSGRADLMVRVAGTRAQPTLDMTAQLDSIGYASMMIERLGASGRYAGRRLEARMDLMRGGTPAIIGRFSLPVELTLFGGRLLDDSLRGTLTADSADFAVLEAFTPSIRRSVGKLNAALVLGGTWKRPSFGGRVLVSDAEATIPELGIRVRGISADVEIAQGRDSVQINRLSGWSGRGPADAIQLAGWTSFRDRDNPSFDLRLVARNFHALDRRTLARLDLSTRDPQTGRDSYLRFNGRLTSSTLSGPVLVDHVTVFLPDQDLARKQVIDVSDVLIDEDTVGAGAARLPTAPSRLIEGLRMSGLTVSLGEDVWLRSREANVKLTGSLGVSGARDQADGAFRLALEGTLNADRGTYTLDLGVVQRDFRVQSGSVTFQGTADNNPMIDISALHTVKRQGKADLGVVVRIHGPLDPYPALDFSSSESFQISQSDLVSYLVTGRPSFENSDDVAGTVASVLLPTASAALSSQLRSWTGGADIQLQGGAAQANQLTGRNGVGGAISNSFWGTRLGAEKQVANNVFVSVTAGLCPFQNKELLQAQMDAIKTAGTDLMRALAFKVDYRFDRWTSIQAGIEPRAQDATCGNGTVTDLRSGTQQLGFSLFRTWHF